MDDGNRPTVLLLLLCALTLALAEWRPVETYSTADASGILSDVIDSEPDSVYLTDDFVIVDVLPVDPSKHRLEPVSGTFDSGSTLHPSTSLFEEDEEWQQTVEESETSHSGSSSNTFEVPSTRAVQEVPDEVRFGDSSEALELFDSKDLEPLEPLEPRLELLGPLDSTEVLALNPLDESYVLISVCGGRYFCPEGSRGPCRPSEVLTSGRQVEEPSCPGERFLWAMGCSLAGDPDPDQDLSDYEGQCSLRDPSRPCYGYPSTFRYSRTFAACYPLPSGWRDADHVCGRGKYFADVDGVYGDCLCRDPDEVVWPANNKCYRLYTRGPCALGDWLMPKNRTLSVCQHSPCPHQADGDHIYWEHSGRPGCYKSHTRGPCRPGHQFVISDLWSRRAECIRTDPHVMDSEEPEDADGPSSEEETSPEDFEGFPPASGETDREGQSADEEASEEVLDAIEQLTTNSPRALLVQSTHSNEASSSESPLPDEVETLTFSSVPLPSGASSEESRPVDPVTITTPTNSDPKIVVHLVADDDAESISVQGATARSPLAKYRKRIRSHRGRKMAPQSTEVHHSGARSPKWPVYLSIVWLLFISSTLDFGTLVP